MSKGLKSYTEDVRIKIILKRIQSNSGGLGFWGAVDALKKVKK